MNLYIDQLVGMMQLCLSSLVLVYYRFYKSGFYYSDI